MKHIMYGLLLLFASCTSTNLASRDGADKASDSLNRGLQGRDVSLPHHTPRLTRAISFSKMESPNLQSADQAIDETKFISLDINPNTLEEFKLGYPTNYEVTRGRLFVNLSRVSREKYYRGKMNIVLEERQSDGTYYKVVDAKLDSGNNYDSKYNVWGIFGGKLGFHGFFSDNKYGSFVLVVNEGVDSLEDVDGDREKIRFADGSVWFMNFRSFTGNNHNECYEGGNYIGLIGHPPKPPKKCWFIGAGPFDCRAWKTGRDDVDTLRNLEPTSSISCYKKLATFEDLNIEEAFNTEEDDDEIVITY